MSKITICLPNIEDCNTFIQASNDSLSTLHPWVKPPITIKEYHAFLERSNQDTHQSFLIKSDGDIAGVININEIVRGCFQSAYLGYYAMAKYLRQGIMYKGLKLAMTHAFYEMTLHRLEANIQPDNVASINLVKKIGFRREGYSPRYLHIDGQWQDHERWAITSEDWPNK